MDQETYQLLTQGVVTGECYRVSDKDTVLEYPCYPEAEQDYWRRIILGGEAKVKIEKIWTVENGKLEVSELLKSST